MDHWARPKHFDRQNNGLGDAADLYLTTMVVAVDVTVRKTLHVLVFSVLHERWWSKTWRVAQRWLGAEAIQNKSAKGRGAVSMRHVRRARRRKDEIMALRSAPRRGIVQQGRNRHDDWDDEAAELDAREDAWCDQRGGR
jgi:hypothetical protein